MTGVGWFAHAAQYPAGGINATPFRHQPKAPSKGFRIDVGLDPESLEPGAFEGAVRVTTDDPDFPEISLPASIVVTG